MQRITVEIRIVENLFHGATPLMSITDGTTVKLALVANGVCTEMLHFMVLL